MIHFCYMNLHEFGALRVYHCTATSQMEPNVVYSNTILLIGKEMRHEKSKGLDQNQLPTYWHHLHWV